MSLFIDKSTISGRGVFTSTIIPSGSKIEVCEVIVFSPHDRKKIDGTILYNYYFGWSEGCGAIALGFGSLFNHSFAPNSRYVKDFTTNTLHFYAITDINPGEEIVVNYNGNPDDTTSIWFEAV